MKLSLKDYNLTSNPFPSLLGIPSSEVSLWADRKEILEKLERIISSTISSNLSNVVLIFGKYGQGKTHTLRYIKTHINSERKDEAIAIYIPTPGNSFIEFYRNIIMEIGRDTILQYAKEFAGSIYFTYAKRLISDVNKGILSRSDFPFHLTNPEIVRSNIRRVLREIAGTDLPDFPAVIIQLPDKSKEEIAWKWLCAHRMSLSELRQLEVTTSIDSDSVAVSALTSLINILHQIGYEVVFILVDELEIFVEQLDEKSRRTFTSHLRDFIDRNPEGLCLFFACAAEVERELKTAVIPALISRIPPGNEVTLENLSKEEVIQFIIDYLDTSRITEPRAKNSKKLFIEQLKPFKPDAIPKILEHSGGDIRKIMRICRTLIEEALILGKNEIDGGLVDEILSRIKT